MRVAVVGAGPKGLYAVEELLARAPRAVVDVWDSRPPGTGAAYATDQPVWLRLNVTSAIIDGFDAWRLARGEAAPLDPFPPRALLGAYLAERLASLFERHAGLSHVARAAGTVEDHIAALHDHKRALATALGPEPTAALTALPDEQLRHVLELDADRLL